MFDNFSYLFLLDFQFKMLTQYDLGYIFNTAIF